MTQIHVVSLASLGRFNAVGTLSGGSSFICNPRVLDHYCRRYWLRLPKTNDALGTNDASKLYQSHRRSIRQQFQQITRRFLLLPPSPRPSKLDQYNPSPITASPSSTVLVSWGGGALVTLITTTIILRVALILTATSAVATTVPTVGLRRGRRYVRVIIIIVATVGATASVAARGGHAFLGVLGGVFCLTCKPPRLYPLLTSAIVCLSVAPVVGTVGALSAVSAVVF